mmetsp:Transcript_49997/g.154987  ORF Transcript_49997/g.154987 Transcript_49997/m.154987 type:complete len:325 (+) Transcript_49997:522-1496(+)
MQGHDVRGFVCHHLHSLHRGWPEGQAIEGHLEPEAAVEALEPALVVIDAAAAGRSDVLADGVVHLGRPVHVVEEHAGDTDYWHNERPACHGAQIVPQAVADGLARDRVLHLLGACLKGREEPLLRHVGHHKQRQGVAHLQGPEGRKDVERSQCNTQDAGGVAGRQEEEAEKEAYDEGHAGGKSEERPEDEARGVQDALRSRLHGDLGDAHVPPVARQEDRDADSQHDAHIPRSEASLLVAREVKVASAGGPDQPDPKGKWHADHKGETDPHEAQAGVLQEQHVGEAESHRDRHGEDERPVVLQGVRRNQEAPDGRMPQMERLLH